MQSRRPVSTRAHAERRAPRIGRDQTCDGGGRTHNGVQALPCGVRAAGKTRSGSYALGKQRGASVLVATSADCLHLKRLRVVAVVPIARLLPAVRAISGSGGLKIAAPDGFANLGICRRHVARENSRARLAPLREVVAARLFVSAAVNANGRCSLHGHAGTFAGGTMSSSVTRPSVKSRTAFMRSGGTPLTFQPNTAVLFTPKWSAIAVARPRSSSSHVVSCMSRV